MSLPSRQQARRTGHRKAAALSLIAFCGTVVLAHSQVKPHQHSVLMVGVRFLPMLLEVKAGDTIVWENRDPFPHNVTADNGQFRSGDIAPEQTGKITVDKRGRFLYVCTLHPGMKGVLTVN